MRWKRVMTQDIDPAALDGRTLAEVFEERYRQLLAEEIREWEPRLGKQEIEIPVAMELISEAVGRWSWERFSPAAGVWPAPRSDDWLRLGRKCRNELDMLYRDLPVLLDRAASPIVWALSRGSIEATGIAIPERASSWARSTIPVGFFEIGLWALHRNGSRLMQLGRDGQALDTGWGAVRISSNAGEPAVRVAGKEAIRRAIRQVNARAAQEGASAPNLLKVVSPVKAILSGQGLTASKDKIQAVAQESEFDGTRAKPGSRARVAKEPSEI